MGLLMALATTASAQHQIVCSGEAAGGYAAFPDICRLQNGDLFCVFYSGYGHVSTPNDKWPKGGRIMAVRSTDNGKTWSNLLPTSERRKPPVRLGEKRTFEQAVRAGLLAILVSPEFLFLQEKPGKLDDFALASRLSYFFWSTMPDEELLMLAEQKQRA